jgi:glycine cleavage system H lipoate-binding protein
LAFAKKSLIKRHERIKMQLKPKVHISHLTGEEMLNSSGFAIPGGVFISKDHCWAGIDQDGNVKIGVDDFAKKLIGNIDDIEFPNLGMNVKVNQPLFSIKQGRRHITFGAPISGNVTEINENLEDNLDNLNISPYDQNWICKIDSENLDTELKQLQIGNSAVTFYQQDIEKYQQEIKKLRPKSSGDEDQLFKGELATLDDYNFEKVVSEFFSR